MIQHDPLSLISEVYSANGQILKSNVYFSVKNEISQYTAISGNLPMEVSPLAICEASQLAEGNCPEKVIATFSLKEESVEESTTQAFTPNQFEASDANSTLLYIVFGIIGLVAVSSVALVSIIALVLGRDISLAAVLGPASSVKLKTEKIEGEN